MNEFLQNQLNCGDALLIGDEIYWKNIKLLKDYHKSTNNNNYQNLEDGYDMNNPDLEIKNYGTIQGIIYWLIHIFKQLILSRLE
jgi:hypothetical protein